MKKSNNTSQSQDQSKRKKKNKLMLILALLFIIGGLQAATQYFAQTFGYQAALGANINHVYAPWSIYTWWKMWYVTYPEHFVAAASIGVLVLLGGVVGCALIARMSAKTAKTAQHLRGVSRWADKNDIIDAGLLGNNKGVYVSAWEEKNGTIHYLRDNGSEPVLAYAPTGSGKSVGLIIPTLLSWPHSAVITDLKGELWALTAGWRQKHAKNKVIRFEPGTLLGSARWNPLDEIRIGTEYDVGDVQNLASIIVDPDGKREISHQQKAAQTLLVGVILHALYKSQKEGAPATLTDIDTMLADANKDSLSLWSEMTSYPHVNGKSHPIISSTAREMMHRTGEDADTVLSVTQSYLALYRDPVVASNVSTSDFRIMDLVNNDDPVTLYIITQQNDNVRLKPLLRVMINMMIRKLADKMEFERIPAHMPWWKRSLATLRFRQVTHLYLRSKKTYKHRLLGMLDEFPSLGKLEILQDALPYIADFGIKFYLTCQDIHQLRNRETGYGPDETITSNCHIQSVYPPSRTETAKHISALTGQTMTVKEKKLTHTSSTDTNQGVRTLQEVLRPLLTVDECLRMPGAKKNAEGQIEQAGDMIVYVAGHPPIYGKQPLYFQDPIFAARAGVSEPKSTDILSPVKTTIAMRQTSTANNQTSMAHYQTSIAQRQMSDIKHQSLIVARKEDHHDMQKVFKRAAIVIVITAASLAVLASALYAAGGRINTSKSLKIGLYWTINAPVTKGRYVIFCPPQQPIFDDAVQRGYISSGFCPGSYNGMMKKISAEKGDTVSVTNSGVFVNNELLPLSKPLSADPSGRPLPRLNAEPHTLGESELLLMTDHSATSFDSRYFGTINRTQVKAVIRPIFTW